jgi:hypothetical protein
MARFLDRNGRVDGRFTQHIRHAEANDASQQACEQTSDQEVAC